MSPEQDQAYMARALQLAELGLYTTHPNPRVGAVLVKDGEIVGEGYHRAAGEPHAERNALALVSEEQARGATVYVTLEPCSHHGRTPPCADALIAAGVGRVVAAMQDPNPLVAGQGLERLRNAGIEVTTGVLEAQARQLNPGFIQRMTHGRPYVRCKLAMSLDGRTAMADGESKWISSEASRADVQRLRARSDAILTGAGTVLHDDPSMNVRLTHAELQIPDDLPLHRPLRVVLDPELKMPSSARMLALPGTTLVYCRAGQPLKTIELESAGAEVQVLDEVDGMLDLHALMTRLAERGINEVLLETGATLAGAMLEQGLIDELIVYIAPHIMGDGARGLFHLPGLAQMADRRPLTFTDVRQIGPDLRITAKPLLQGVD